MSIPLRLLAGIAIVVGTVLTGALAFAGDADKQIAAIAPYLDEQTILVAHVDMSKIDIDATVELIEKVVTLSDRESAKLKQSSAATQAWLDAFNKAGGRHVYAVVSLADLQGPSRDPTLFTVIPVSKDSDATTLQAMIPKGRRGPFEEVVRLSPDGPIIAGSEKAMARLRTMNPVENPHVAEAIAAVERSAVQVILLPTSDHRRVIREMFPKLPKPFDGVDGPTLADGLLWASVGVNIMPDFDARLVIGSRNAEAAGRMAVAWKQLIDVVASEIKHRMESGPPRAQELMPLVDEIITQLQPSVEVDRLVIAITKEAIHPVVQQFLIPAVDLRSELE